MTGSPYFCLPEETAIRVGTPTGNDTKDNGMKIHELCEDERPREKMLEKGAGALSKAELIAIMIRTGTGKKNAIEIARELLKTAGGSLTAASSMSIDSLCGIKGIGPSKAVAITAALELGKRFMEEASAAGRSPQICTPGKVYEVMLPIMKGKVHEECWALFLNRSNRIIGKERISSGGMTATTIDNRMLVRKALEKNACSIILVHNHPSGDPTPGIADISSTSALRHAVKTFDITLTDHVIISDDRYYSFADEQIYYK